MTYTTLDKIVRRTLLENGMPIHWYAEYLYVASTCLRELTFDTLKIINTKEIVINDDGSADLPDDFSDDLLLSYATGGVLKPVTHKDNLNPIQLHDPTTGQFVQNTNNQFTYSNGLFSPLWGGSWYWNVSDYGESTGGLYGAFGGNPNGYQVFKERGQLQLYGYCNAGVAVFQYISDGQSIDNASQVDTLAFATIQSFINWKKGTNKDNEFSPEARAYYNTKRKLRARLDPLTVTDIRNILHSAYSAAIKN